MLSGGCSEDSLKNAGLDYIDELKIRFKVNPHSSNPRCSWVNYTFTGRKLFSPSFSTTVLSEE